MTDQPLESAPEPAKVELPTPTFETASAAEPTSAVDAKSLAKEVAELLRPEIAKTVQSVKDRRFDRVEKALGLADLEELGVAITPEIKNELRMRQLEAQREQPVQEPSPGKVETPDSEKVSQVIKQLELDANNADTIKLLQGQYRNFDHFVSEAQALKLRQFISPSASAAPAMQSGGPVSTGETPEQRRARLFPSSQNIFDVDAQKKAGGGVIIRGG